MSITQVIAHRFFPVWDLKPGQNHRIEMDIHNAINHPSCADTFLHSVRRDARSCGLAKETIAQLSDSIIQQRR